MSRWDWYGERGIQIRTFWQLVVSVVVLAAAVGVGQAKSDVDDLLARQAKDDKAKMEAAEQGVAARKQQCKVTPIFVKALDTSKLSAEEEKLFSESIHESLKGCP